MSDISYLNQVPLDAIICDADTVVMRRDVFERIDDYTQSRPTSPSPGRIYRKNLHWTGPPANWFVYICWGDTSEPGVWHRGRPVHLVDL